jgi:hypothetical protein
MKNSGILTCEIIARVSCHFAVATAGRPQFGSMHFLLGLQSEQSPAFIANAGSLPGLTNDADRRL